MPDNRPIVVNINAVTHRYGRLLALDDVSFSVPSGSSVAFIGPDGVGKSTLLALIAGVKRIQSGSVAVFGGDMASHRHRDAVAARVAYMPQGLGRNLYPTLSVVENIDFFGACTANPSESVNGGSSAFSSQLALIYSPTAKPANYREV